MARGLLIRRYRQTGELKPKPRGGGASAKITRADLAPIEQLVEEQPDALLRELCSPWEQKQRIKVSISTMHRRLQDLRLTTKKNSWVQVSKIAQE